MMQQHGDYKHMKVLFRYYLASDDFENLLLRSHESAWHFLVKLPAVPTRPVITSLGSHHLNPRNALLEQIIEELELVRYWNSECCQSHMVPYLLNIGNIGSDSSLTNCIERQQKFSYCLVDKVVVGLLTRSPSHGTKDVSNYLETVLREWEEAF